MTLPALTDLLPAGTRTPQSYAADESAGVLYVAQLVDGTETTGDIRISRHALSDGLLLDSMLVKGMGHAVSFGVEPMPESKSSPRRSWLWIEAPPLTGQGSGQARGSRISRVSYVPDRTLWWAYGRWVASDNPRPAQWMWDPYPDDTEITPQVCGDMLITRRRTAGGRRIAAHRLAEVLATYTAGDPAPVAVWDVPQPDLPAVFQGYTYHGGCVYLLTGGVGEGPFLTALDPATGAAITGTLPAPTWPEGFEAEGMAVIGGQVTYGTVRRTPRRRITISPIPDDDDKESDMAPSVCLTYSRQLGNQYAGGATGTADSEGAQMAALAPQVADRLRQLGVTVYLMPPTDQNGDRAINYRDELAYASRPPQAGAALGISLHSNALGDAVVLYGTSRTSATYASKAVAALAKYCPMPFGDRWTLSDHKVAVLTDTPQPYLLLEVGRHDTLDYAAWLRSHIADGSLGRALGNAIAVTLGVTIPAEPEPTPAVPLLVVDGVRGPKTDAAIDRQCATTTGTKALQGWLNTQMWTRS